jgi:hypothetical protein
MLPYILAAIGGWLIGDSLESKTPAAAVTEIKDDVVEAVIDIKDDVVDTVDTKKPEPKDDGYAKGGKVAKAPKPKVAAAKPKAAKKSGGGSGKVGMISAHAKATRKDGEKWTDAIKRASAELKQQGKI